MNEAGTILFGLAIAAVVILAVIGMKKTINYLKKTDEDKKNDKDDDNCWLNNQHFE